MKRVAIVLGTICTMLVLLAVAMGGGERDIERHPEVAVTHESSPPMASAFVTDKGFLYGRVTTVEGTTYEGRLRWGGDEEAFWSDTFDGLKDGNPWATHVPAERLLESRTIQLFGIEVAQWERQIDQARPFMARFGDIATIEARAVDLTVTMKSGSVFQLDRLSSDDLADGVRVWDVSRGVVDVDESHIRAIELFPTPGLNDIPVQLHGTVKTRHAEFTGFVRWDWEKSVSSDVLHAHSSDGERDVRFDNIRSISRNSDDGAKLSLVDGREIELFGTRDVGKDNRGIGVHDSRYGRVLVSWDAFESIDFTAGGNGPAYNDFPPGRHLAGTVTTVGGRRLTGRLVYDLDESETTETLDAPSQGVNYNIPMGLIASIIPFGGGTNGDGRARVILYNGEELQLERSGDLGETNLGMLVFIEGRDVAEHVPWSDVERVDLDRPPAMYPDASAAPLQR